MKFTYVLLILPALLLLGSCGMRLDTPTSHDEITGTSQNNLTRFDGRERLASGVELKSHGSDGIRQIIYADEMSIAPRSFAAFNINTINELLIENTHIEIFPSPQKIRNAANGGSIDTDFSVTLRQFVEKLPDDYGLISRINMQNVRITLHKAGKEGSAITVRAKRLVKEFDDDTYPDLYDVNFYDGNSTVGLKVSHARWNTQTGQFEVKAL